MYASYSFVDVFFKFVQALVTITPQRGSFLLLVSKSNNNQGKWAPVKTYPTSTSPTPSKGNPHSTPLSKNSFPTLTTRACYS